jgi:cytochrome c oxidase subunit 1
VKFVHAVFTGMVAVPTLLTVFTITASVEIAGRLRGGRGAFGWLTALPWKNPMMLAVAFSFVLLGFGGAGGMVNMSYQLDFAVHNTQWITGHFHLIFAGAIVIMYFAIAYDLWPHLTGKALSGDRLMRAQLWLWFVGMIIVTFPWHYVGILGMPRRMAYFDYNHPAIAPEAISVTITFFGGLLLIVSAVLFLLVLIRGHLGRTVEPPEFRFSVPAHPTRIPKALNTFGLWLALMVGLSVVNYGYPIAHLMTLKQTSVPAVPIGSSR